MAEINKITLRIHVPSKDADMTPLSPKKEKAEYLEMATGEEKIEGCLKGKVAGSDKEQDEFIVSIQKLSYTKKIYSPNAVMVELHIKNSDQNSTAFPSKSQVKDFFLKSKVELFYNNSTDHSICNDYYVQKIEPLYTKEDLFVSLAIYSPDYQLAIDEACRSFVAMRLSEVLDKQKSKFVLPYDNKKNVKIDWSNMQHLVRDGKEHIFPYLVQYNESYYDFLRRTTNRWGEFLYYENGQLNVGYDNNAKPKEVTNFNSRTYIAIDADAENGEGNKLHPQATADKNMLDNPMKKDGYEAVKNEMVNITDPDAGQDKYIMSKIASFFTNGKSFMDWLIDTAVSDTVSWTKAFKKAKNNNAKHNEKYFNEKNIKAHPDQYSADHTKFNEFSENSPFLNANRYSEILNMELKASREAMKIDFLTTYPNLKLGEIIKVANETYLVVELNGNLYESDSLYYDATCISIDTYTYKEKKMDDTEQEFTYTGYFPPYLETGHIRVSGLQHATVVDNADPLRSNRVRVRFSWQNEKDTPSPWLQFAQNATTGSAGVHGRHYVNETVLVDFINGNVERPYVIGAVSKSAPTPLKTGSIAMMSPAGHGMRVADGTGTGLTAFLASVSPSLKMVQGYFPKVDLIGKFGPDEKLQTKFKRLEGNTEICDHYGIYSIKGSTDSRNITIKSPWGDVKINAFTGITVSAPNGDVKISGKNVTIEAGNNLKLVSGTNIKQKFASRYGKEFDTLMIAQDISKRVTKKLLATGMPIPDLSLLRNTLEVFLKPQEGTLELKSNRFLKLSAGGSAAGFPDTLYANPKARAQKMMKENGTLKMAPAIVELIGKVGPCIDTLVEKYKVQYNDCISKREALKKAIDNLQHFSNPDFGLQRDQWPKVCNTYEDLQSKLWNPATKEIKVEDLAFAENQTSDTDLGTINQWCIVRCGTDSILLRGEDKIRNYIFKQRKNGKKTVVARANALLKSIHKLWEINLFKSDFNKDLRPWFGFFTRYVPDDYIGAFHKAFRNANCKEMFLYKFMYGEDNAIADARSALTRSALENDHAFDRHKKAFKRLIALNLLEQWGITQQKAIKFDLDPATNLLKPVEEAKVPAKPQTEEDLCSPKWHLYLKSLTIDELSVIKKEKANILTSEIKNAWDKFKFLKPFWEYSAYGSAGKGKILFADGKTFELKGSNGNEIVATYNKGKLKKTELLNDGEQQIEAFMQPIIDALSNMDFNGQNIYAPDPQQINEILNINHQDNAAVVEVVDEFEID